MDRIAISPIPKQIVRKREENAKQSRLVKSRIPMALTLVAWIFTMGKKRRKSSLEKQLKRSREDDANPLYQKLRSFLDTLTPDEKDSFFDETRISPERRGELWMKQADLGEKLVNQFAWACPDDRAINILRKFSPIVEIGCGSNAYWARMMQKAGVDVIAYDADPDGGGKIARGSNKDSSHEFRVRKGGPSILRDTEDRTLFLCYPDESGEVHVEGFDAPMSMGAACLEYFQGEYVIHVGEIFGSTLSLDQAPWGRSSGPTFQERLAAEYHCLLQISLPSWIHVRDTLTVWKRSQTCSIVFESEGNDEEDEEVEYKHIPPHERLPVDIAAPCLAHLLESEVVSTIKSEVVSTATPQTSTEKEGFDAIW